MRNKNIQNQPGVSMETPGLDGPTRRRPNLQAVAEDCKRTESALYQHLLYFPNSPERHKLYDLYRILWFFLDLPSEKIDENLLRILDCCNEWAKDFLVRKDSR